jgi:hypothetical protein
MTPLTKWTVVAVCLTVLAALVPWASWGQFDVELVRLPLWWAYLGPVVVMHAAALVPLRAARVVAVVAGAVALVAAVVVAAGYDDGAAIFDQVVPAVAPRPGLGVVFASASVLAQGVGLRARRAVPAG